MYSHLFFFFLGCFHTEVCSTTSENNLPRKGHDGDTPSTRFSNDYQHSEMRAKEVNYHLEVGLVIHVYFWLEGYLSP